MQLMPFWGKVYSDCRDMYDVRTNIICGVRVYRIYLDQYGDASLALAAYNRGPRVINYERRIGKDPVKGYSGDVMAFFQQLKVVSPVTTVASVYK